jgi:minor extracellular serine protease Vpr
MSKPRGRHGLFLLAVVLLVSVGLGVPQDTGRADTETAGLLWLNPPSPSAAVGTSFLLDLQLDGSSDVYGAQIELAFDPAYLEVVGSVLVPGTCPQPDFVVTNTADNVAGTAEYAVSQLNPTPPCGAGVVATMEMMCKAETPSPTSVSIVSSLISDPDGIAIAHSTQDATVECVGGFVVVGTVGLQSWPGGPEGVSVVLRDSGGAIVDEVVVGPSGAFSLTAGDVAETYSVEASYPRYLSVEASGITGGAGDTVNIGDATLPAGDLNGDGVINIQDITVVAGNFLKTSPVAWGP